MHRFLRMSRCRFPAAARCATHWMRSLAVSIWEGGLISFSFTFVPMLLFNVVKTGFGFAMDIYDHFSDRFSFSREGTDLMQFLSARYKEEQEQTPAV